MESSARRHLGGTGTNLIGIPGIHAHRRGWTGVALLVESGGLRGGWIVRMDVTQVSRCRHSEDLTRPLALSKVGPLGYTLTA